MDTCFLYGETHGGSLGSALNTGVDPSRRRESVPVASARSSAKISKYFKNHFSFIVFCTASCARKRTSVETFARL